MHKHAISIAREIIARLNEGATTRAFESVAELSVDFCEAVRNGGELKLPFLVYRVEHSKTPEERHAKYLEELYRTNLTRGYIAEQAKRLQGDIATALDCFTTDPYHDRCKESSVSFTKILDKKQVMASGGKNYESLKVKKYDWPLGELQTEAIANLNSWIRFLESQSPTGITSNTELEDDAGKSADDNTKNKIYPHPDEYERDKWIYENINCHSFADLSQKLNSLAPKKSWNVITARNAFKKAADRFSMFHTLEQKRFLVSRKKTKSR